MKIVRTSLNEVIKSEDEWADREIDRYQGKKVEKPKENINISDFPDKITDDIKRNILQGDDYSSNKKQLVFKIIDLEGYIYDNGTKKQIEQWNEYKNLFTSRGLDWDDLEIEQLQGIFFKLRLLCQDLRWDNK